MKKLILIDGNAILHRAFHALPPLTNKEGILANAVYGFFSMILKINVDLKPDFLVVCFDRPKPTFRQELYVGYQAQRPSMDEGLVPQILLVHKGLEDARIPIFEVDGYEADDLIGTLSVQAVKDNKEDIQVIILSGDRDLLQLVNHKVKVLAPIVGMSKMILFDSKAVEEKYGLKPEQIIDYKALRGDPSDNYPGVLGVGQKTASNLLQKYKNLEEVYKHIDEIPKNLAQKLAEGAEAAGLAKKLATIVLDAPVRLDIKKASIENLSKEDLKKFFSENGFRSLLERLEKVE
ncbi:MAG TPA: 5'-3' exonuclease H3TH domain-containing protein, partial [Patescibacteria group bacterium]|nr:5'-3' exonuclease H3TH domain-containing protein [Patescibacteria group bacterium]